MYWSFIFSICIISLFIIIGLVHSIYAYSHGPSYPHKAKVNKLMSEFIAPSVTRRELKKSTIPPSDMYNQHIEEYKVSTSSGECANFKGSLHIIACPGRQWKGMSSDHIFWPPETKEPAKANELKIHIYNNCNSEMVFQVMGDPINSSVEMIEPQQTKTLVFVLPLPQAITLFGQSQCQDNNTENCDVCECIRTPGSDLCEQAPSVCSSIDIKITETGEAHYAINNNTGFTTAYIVMANPECPVLGGDLEVTTKHILNQCPNELVYSNKKGTVTACASMCKVCQLEEMVQSCQCIRDIDCADCTVYSDQLPSGDATPPLVCIANRCRSKLTQKFGPMCNDKFTSIQGDISYTDMFCCENKQSAKAKNKVGNVTSCGYTSNTSE